MKAFEFLATLQSANMLAIPSEVASQLTPEQSIRVLLLVADSDEDQDWAKLTADQFLQGYDPGDSIYDQLHAG